MPELRLGPDDLWAAYSRVPSREMGGLQSAVLNFNRVSQAMSVFARVFRASCCDHFFDDYMDVNSTESDITPTPNNNNQVISSEWFFVQILSLVGVRLEPKNASMHKHGLGVDADLSTAASSRRVIFKPTSDRTDLLSTPSRRSRRITTSPRAWQPPSLVSCISCSSLGLTSAAVEQRSSLWCSVHHSYQHRESPEKVLCLLQAPWS